MHRWSVAFFTKLNHHSVKKSFIFTFYNFLNFNTELIYKVVLCCFTLKCKERLI